MAKSYYVTWEAPDTEARSKVPTDLSKLYFHQANGPLEAAKKSALNDFSTVKHPYYVTVAVVALAKLKTTWRQNIKAFDIYFQRTISEVAVAGQ